MSVQVHINLLNTTLALKSNHSGLTDICTHLIIRDQSKQNETITGLPTDQRSTLYKFSLHTVIDMSITVVQLMNTREASPVSRVLVHCAHRPTGGSTINNQQRKGDDSS